MDTSEQATHLSVLDLVRRNARHVGRVVPTRCIKIEIRGHDATISYPEEFACAPDLSL